METPGPSKALARRDEAPASEAEGASAAERLAALVLVAVAAVALFAFAYARFASFHNRTFDLAFYARMAWGLARADAWDPILGANVLGLHVSPVLLPIGLVGRVVGTVPALLAAQALAVALAAIPLARLGARRLGPGGALVGAAALLLHPNLGHVATYEFHPGTLAVLPLAWLVEALDRHDARAVLLASAGVLACREDLALITAIAGGLLVLRPATRRAGGALAVGSMLYLGLFFAVVHPLFKPASGSLEAHFGRWGGSVGEVLATWAREPGLLLAHLATEERLTYLPRVLGPLLLLPLRSPRHLALASPILGVALLSDFPTTTRLDSHYLTAAVPALVGGALVAAGRLRRGFGARRWAVALGVASVGGFLLAGGVPPALASDPDAFEPGPRTADKARLIARIPAGASVQAPDPLLAHLSERPRVHRGPPPDRATDFVVLDLSHRRRYARSEDLLRTIEEPIARRFFARTDLHLADRAGRYALFARGAIPHAVRVAEYRGRFPGEQPPTPLTDCLGITGATRAGEIVRLFLEATGPCPDDLAIRIGADPDPTRVDLLFGGWLSPAHLRAGDALVSEHAMKRGTRWIHVGALRSSGAPPRPSDPRSVRVPLAE